ncbi:MAG: hypothetical protein OXU42_00585, partial [Deltaproteobacteria bacterium]|nr:hypothetical protein [Deltaproteobacteria bacterium]
MMPACRRPVTGCQGASFDFAPLALRYAQDERKVEPLTVRKVELPPFVLSVAERQRSEVEGR